MTSIQNPQNPGGILGVLQYSGGDGSVVSILGESSKTANNFALISQNSVTNASASSRRSPRPIATSQRKKLQDSLDPLTAQQNMVAAKNVLDPVIYFPNGSTIEPPTTS